MAVGNGVRGFRQGNIGSLADLDNALTLNDSVMSGPGGAAGDVDDVYMGEGDGAISPQRQRESKLR